jgi:hypothetical protein
MTTWNMCIALLDKYGHRRTLIMCHTYFFSTVTKVKQTRDSMLRLRTLPLLSVYNHFKINEELTIALLSKLLKH